jgi:Tfp pilus assembly pilus retraction ATPase PilT
VSGPVDVLAVLEQLRLCAIRGCGCNETHAAEIMEARTAVTELIKAAKEMMLQDAVQRATFNTNPFMADAADKLNAAIGKVGAR